MKECNCWLGILNDYHQTEENNIYLDDYISKLNERHEYTKRMSGYFNGKVIQPIDYLDRRKSMSALFGYCPICGVKINWGKIKQPLKD